MKSILQSRKQKKIIINKGLGERCKEGTADNGFIACVWSSPTEIQPRLLEKLWNQWPFYDLISCVQYLWHPCDCSQPQRKDDRFSRGLLVHVTFEDDFPSSSVCRLPVLKFLSHIQWPASCTVLLSNLTVTARIMLATIKAPPSPKGSSSEAKCKQGCCICFISPVLKMEMINLKWLECDCPFAFFYVVI